MRRIERKPYKKRSYYRIILGMYEHIKKEKRCNLRSIGIACKANVSTVRSVVDLLVALGLIYKEKVGVRQYQGLIQVGSVTNDKNKIDE